VPDKPAHVLEIPASLGRDVDKAKEGKLKAPIPAEAFLSDSALQQIADMQAKEPVHAEALRPISRQEAASRTTFTKDGEAVPVVPQMRRVIPVPFQRPRINAGSHGKAWQYVSADEIVIGDLIPDVGLVEHREDRTVYALREDVLAGTANLHPIVADSYGSLEGYDPEDLVPVGMVVIVTGKGGVRRAFRGIPAQQVQVFRKVPE
jgi:hypothetical protein